VLLERGAAKVYAAARSPDQLTRHWNRDCLVPIRLDVTVPAEIAAAADACPGVNLVVCNAGQTCVGGVVAPPDEVVFRDAFEVNFFGPRTLTKCFAPALRRIRGRLLFVSSLSGLLISRSSPIYSATKAACLMMAAGARDELGVDGVTVTSTLPGFIDTDMTTSMAIQKGEPAGGGREVARRSRRRRGDGVP